MSSILVTPMPGQSFDFDWALKAPQPECESTLPVSLHFQLIAARAVSSDGSLCIEFDARPVLSISNAETLHLLADEAFIGNGPGCRRVLELAGADAEMFLTLVERRQLDWTLSLDAKRAVAWVQEQRPNYINLCDPDMVLG